MKAVKMTFVHRGALWEGQEPAADGGGVTGCFCLCFSPSKLQLKVKVTVKKDAVVTQGVI